MLTLNQIERVDAQLTTQEDVDRGIDRYSFSHLEAINTCPAWGIIRYSHRRVPFVSAKRAMALEAGQASHQVFAAARIYQLGVIDGKWDHAVHHGERIFGEERFESMRQHVTSGEDKQTAMLNFSLDALYTCGFYDDPSDQRRTMSNIEESCIAYIDRLDTRHPIWVADDSDPTAPVGVEVPFDIVIEFVPQETTIWDKGQPTISFRYVGVIDGIHVHSDGTRTHENKTGSRINDAWAMSMEMTHQITGYCFAAGLVLGVQTSKAMCHGMAIPLPKMIDYGVLTINVRRGDHNYHDWLEWLLHTVQVDHMWRDRPTEAPRYTRACNRYFHPCSMIPLCGSLPEDRKIAFEEMEIEERHTEDVVSDG